MDNHSSDMTLNASSCSIHPKSHVQVGIHYRESLVSKSDRKLCEYSLLQRTTRIDLIKGRCSLNPNRINNTHWHASSLTTVMYKNCWNNFNRKAPTFKSHLPYILPGRSRVPLPIIPKGSIFIVHPRLLSESLNCASNGASFYIFESPAKIL